MNKTTAIKVGSFNEEQLKKREDKVACEKAMEKTGLKYTRTKIVKKKGTTYLELYLISNEEYYNSTEI